MYLRKKSCIIVHILIRNKRYTGKIIFVYLQTTYIMVVDSRARQTTEQGPHPKECKAANARFPFLEEPMAKLKLQLRSSPEIGAVCSQIYKVPGTEEPQQMTTVKGWISYTKCLLIHLIHNLFQAYCQSWSH